MYGMIITVIILWFMLRIINSNNNDNSNDFINDEELEIVPLTSQVIPGVRQCLRDGFYSTKNIDDYLERYDNCLKYLPYQEFDTYNMGRYGEKKVFLPLSQEFNDKDCLWLTIGIGSDEQVEREFKSKHPGCKIFGIEASPDQYGDFASVGTIIPYGVGVNSGVFTLTVREGIHYYEKNVTVLRLTDILDKYLGKRIVHYLTIDIEGFEYSILKEILTGRILANEGIVFCQIDAELHENRLDADEPLQHFLHLFNMDKSNYLPIFHTPFLQHQKITFINIDHHECQSAFNLSPYMV